MSILITDPQAAASRVAAVDYASPIRPGEAPPLRPIMPGWLGVPVRAWWMAGMLLTLFVALYWTSLSRIWRKTNPIDGTDEWAHAIFVPIIGLYYLYLNLDELLATPVKPVLGTSFTRNRLLSGFGTILLGLLLWKVLPNLPGPFRTYQAEIDSLGIGVMILGGFGLVFDWGLGTLLAGLLTYVYGVYPGRNDFVKDVGMVMTVFGMVLTIGGWRIMRIAWFPCVFLLFALPWPGLFYSKVAGPLQNLAAQVAVGVMQLFGVDATNEGVTIVFNSRPELQPLSVAEACSGIKSLMTFVSLGASIAFLSSRPLWQKIIITFAGVPIAVLCNVLRVSGQGLLHYYVDETWSSGFAHQFAGIVLLLPGFLMLLGLVWILDVLFVEEGEHDASSPANPPGSAATSAAASSGGVA